MEFNFQYLAVMKQHNLELKDLSDDAKGGIDDINYIVKAINMAEKSNKKVSDATIKKLNRLDKWVSLEILDDHLGKDDNEEDKEKFDEVVEEIKEEIKNDDSAVVGTNDGVNEDVIDANIDVELKALHDTDPNKEYTIDELKKVAPVAYNYIWDSYKEGEENGVTTSNYDVSENPETKLYIIKSLKK